MPDIEQIARETQTRLALLEQEIKQRVADRDWVRDYIEPSRVAIIEIKNAQVAISNDMRTLTDRVTSVFAAHDTFLEERRQQERSNAKDSTPLGLIKKYTPVGGAILLLFTIFRIAGTVFEYYLNNLPKK